MNRFAELLDRLAYEPGRNNKLRLVTEYFHSTPDPERGFALAALTGSLSFRHAKPSMIRALIWERSDPVLFELSADYVGDLSETVALMWPSPLPSNAKHLAGRGRGWGAGDRASSAPPPQPSPPLASARGGRERRGSAHLTKSTIGDAPGSLLALLREIRRVRRPLSLPGRH
jgi:DNA ligase 1